jgi:D-methionine transport system permease protein
MALLNLTNYMSETWSLIGPELLETLYMVFFSTVFSLILGAPLGIILVITEKNHIWEKPGLNNVLSFIVNITRSLPFIILIIALFPLSRLIVGTSIGSTAAIVPLSIAAAPFAARIIESSLREVSWGVIEASLSLGASVPQIIFKVLIKEAIPSLILGVTNITINILGYSAMAGAIGGGGLGDLAIRYGYQRFQTDILIITIIVLIILVEVIQNTGNFIVNKISRK